MLVAKALGAIMCVDTLLVLLMICALDTRSDYTAVGIGSLWGFLSAATCLVFLLLERVGGVEARRSARSTRR